MGTIYILWVFKFLIRDFPLNLHEIFQVIQQVVNRLGKILAVELFKRLEKGAYLYSHHLLSTLLNNDFKLPFFRLFYGVAHGQPILPVSLISIFRS